MLATRPGGGDCGRFFADGAEQEAWTSATFDADLEQLCRSHEDQVVALVRDRRCQMMNEVNRCAAALVPALAFVHAHVDNRPVALIEVGASAGLQLLFDRYRYEYVTSVPVPAEHAPKVGESTFTWVPPDARDDVTFRCEVTGESFPDPAAVSGLVSSRIGIDLDPPRLADPDTREWIVASAAMRSGLTAHLIDVVRDAGVQVVAADAVEVIEQMIVEVPDSCVPVVYDSASLMYLDADRVAQFRAALARAGRQREMVWISNEAMRVAEDGSVVTVQGAAVADDVAARLRAGAFQFAVELSVVGPADRFASGVGWQEGAAAPIFESRYSPSRTRGGCGLTGGPLPGDAAGTESAAALKGRGRGEDSSPTQVRGHLN